ncbi:hypothetical protein KHQ06_19865 [Nocardia tengchongensis]|uniref:GNAT family N-acetyltransferase n=1 Tax=Nocardia tengchongensis TaxID=2055889 RepID=A0ABX8CFQ9_9NOCA|nr:hypothetical protein [Nocardia tengchongensis]QVI18787.1 hypothetical protein KHQ06_19865 [Nocardia tengchongensis]
MPDLQWCDVEELFDPDMMGSLPDVYVQEASVEDWQAVFELIRSQGWAWEYCEGDRKQELPAAAEVLSRPNDAECVTLRVWPVPNVQMIFRPWPGEIDFDVDLRELQGQAGVDILCDFLCAIGRRLGKPVLMCSEFDSFSSRFPVLGFDPAADRVVLLADRL